MCKTLECNLPILNVTLKSYHATEKRPIALVYELNI